MTDRRPLTYRQRIRRLHKAARLIGEAQDQWPLYLQGVDDLSEAMFKLGYVMGVLVDDYAGARVFRPAEPEPAEKFGPDEWANIAAGMVDPESSARRLAALDHQDVVAGLTRSDPDVTPAAIGQTRQDATGYPIHLLGIEPDGRFMCSYGGDRVVRSRLHAATIEELYPTVREAR